jgi:hypothetical protein
MDRNMMGGGMMGGSAFMWFWALFAVLVLALLVVGVVWLVRPWQAPGLVTRPALRARSWTCVTRVASSPARNTSSDVRTWKGAADANLALVAHPHRSS